jgi:Tol biopolymer transport system component
VPFDLTAISNAHSWVQLQEMKGCFTYGTVFPNQAPTMGVRWSQDSKKVAVNSKNAEGGILVEQIRVFDISACNGAALQLDNFPATRFTMSGYNTKPVIPTFSWDGNTLFVLNSIFRYDLGYMYEYNMEKMRGKMIDPLKTSCCYTMARFSPDGSYLLFAYQDINGGAAAKTQLYYISYGSIGGGSSYAPLPLPDGFFSVPADHLDAALRPVIP